MAAASILLAEDEPSTRDAIAKVLRDGGYAVTVAGDGAEALSAIGQGSYDVVITDLWMPGADGLSVLRRTRELAPQTIVLLISALGSFETAVEALREGATDYIQKPVVFSDLLHKVRRLLEWRELAWESQVLRRQIDSHYDFAPLLIGRTAGVQRIRSLILQVAPTNSTVLITGESGVGKEVVARAIHQASHLRDQLFLPVNCGAIPGELLESQLFGHTKGAFTGADSAYEGLFRRARGGTIFLDEIGELPPNLQVKLLRAIEEKEILPIGTATPIAVKVRIIASTNRDLHKAVEEGRFREDLYYRLNVVGIEVPPLRDRREDVPLLVEYLLRRHNAELKRSFKGVDNATMKLLMLAPWKGNIRELDNVIESAMIVGDGEWIRAHDLPRPIAPNGPGLPEMGDNLTQAVRIFEKAHIENVLKRSGSDKRKAAERLGINLSTLYRKIQDLDIRSGAEEEVSPESPEA